MTQKLLTGHTHRFRWINGELVCWESGCWTKKEDYQRDRHAPATRIERFFVSHPHTSIESAGVIDPEFGYLAFLLDTRKIAFDV